MIKKEGQTMDQDNGAITEFPLTEPILLIVLRIGIKRDLLRESKFPAEMVEAGAEVITPIIGTEIGAMTRSLLVLLNAREEKVSKTI